MQIAPCFRAVASSARVGGRLGALALVALVLGCAETPGSAPTTATAAAPAPPPAAAPAVAPTPPPPPPEPVPFDQAVLNAANGVFSGAKLPDSGVKHVVVIDPLVDGMTGVQSNATQSIQSRIVALARDKYPQFDVQPFTAANVNRAPLVLVGTFTPVAKDGKTAGTREAYRFCLVMADLKSGKTVAKGVARARMDGVDATPTASFRDSPAWTQDKNIQSYINTCQGTKPGDPIDPTYLDGILTASLISDAIDAYNAGRYEEALQLYESARQTPAGDQLRVYNGIYLANMKLGRRDRAEEAFVKIVDYGLRNNRLAVKLLFRPGSTAFVPDQQVSGQYNLWLREIARRAATSPTCLEVAGHTSPTGPAPLNERLSLLRAEYVKARLENEEPPLARRMIANGVGARENLVGTGTDNESDALDRRVEFKVIPSC